MDEIETKYFLDGEVIPARILYDRAEHEMRKKDKRPRTPENAIRVLRNSGRNVGKIIQRDE